MSTMAKIVYWPRITLARSQIISSLSQVEGVELVVAESLPALLQALKGARGLVLADAPRAQAQQVVDALSRPDNTVGWMHLISAGREGFEAVGWPAGAAVTWAAGGVSPTVAEHAMTLLLALARSVPEILAQQGKKDWSRAASAKAVSLEGALMMIVGLGHIGREIAKRARAFDMRIEAVTRTPTQDPLVDAVHPMSSFDEVLARADAIVLAAALTPATRHLINARTLALCKPRALLVNIARGGLVDQAALSDALVAGTLAGAGLDVVDPEPLPAEDPLWTAPNLIISPHFAGGGSTASLNRLASGAANNLRRFLAGESLLHRIQ